MALTEKLKGIADAIRSKTGKSGSLTIDQMIEEIGALSYGSSSSSGLTTDTRTVTTNSSGEATATYSKPPRFVTVITGGTKVVAGNTVKCATGCDFSIARIFHAEVIGADSSTLYQIYVELSGSSVNLYVYDLSASHYIANTQFELVACFE